MEKSIMYIGGIVAVILLLFVVSYFLGSHNTSASTTVSTTQPSSIPATSSVTSTISNFSSGVSNKLNEYVYVTNIGNFSMNSGSVSVINVSTNKVIATIPAGISAEQIVFAPDDSHFYILNNSEYGQYSIEVVNTLRNQIIDNIPLGPQYTSGMYITPNGKFIYVIIPNTPVSVTITNTTTGAVQTIQTGGYGTIRIINLSTYLIWNVTVGIEPESITFAPNQNYAYVTNHESNSLSVINIISESVVSTIPITEPTSIITSQDGKSIYVVSQNKNSTTSISVVNPSLNSVYKNITLNSLYSYSSFIGGVNTASNLMYVFNYDVNSISVINMSTNLLVGSNIQLSVSPSSMVFAPNGKLAYILGNPGLIDILNLSTNKVSLQVPVQNDSVAINITEDGKFIYVANDQNCFASSLISCSYGTVSVINTTDNKIISTIKVGIIPTSVSITQ